ncbi:MAG: carboxymuconolactone decarboxylase family protein [Syntrophomonadaceae bacterium]|nr:carboxymuconolactone decarboxylase family protein [Syntrophomonadaceae bacterium]MDD3890389.1 carboxymuconolactone decarboxylase family protein [Syntrophomonadaceae bacterium]MDD4550291.1 carboxymuconolactone decarboxylase family protein [Syntrophomonadaceae bacterium]
MASGNPREMLNAFTGGLKDLAKTNGANVRAFSGLLETTYKAAALDTKTKELISVAIGAYNRCEYCIVFHVYKALEAGATREEILDAAMVAVAFGGGPSMAYTVTLLKDSLDEFAPDFNK